MRRTVRVWPIFAFLACVLIAFVVSTGELNGQIKELDERYSQSRIKYNQLTGEQEKLKNTLDIVDTDAFIEYQAREYGYMREGELRFVITNPEVLYGTDEWPGR